jgi:glycosyltransferase involved in cell wall biosynthesis
VTSLQLVIPCYNEAERLKPEPFLELLSRQPDVDLIFVNDGSTDATAALLESMAADGHGRIALLSLKQNAGKARAVQLGVLAAFDRRPEFVGFWDADLATPLTSIPEFLEVFRARPAVEIVIGSRVKLLGRNITRSMLRHYPGRMFATAASVTLGIGVYDTQCGAKIFRATETVRQLFATPFRSKWIFDVEILARYIGVVGRSQAEAQIYELPLQTWTGIPGSNVRIRHALRAIWELALIARQS